MKKLKSFISLLLVFSLCSQTFAVTQFTATVKSSSGDYPSLSAAEAGLQTDLTAATIKVFSISAASTPTLVAGDSATGQTSAATGTVILVNGARTQVLISGISGTFQSGEVVQKTSDASVTVTLSSAGDSPIAGIELYAMADSTYALFDGWSTNSTNYIRVYTAIGEGHAYTASTGYRHTSASGIDVFEDFVRFEGVAFQRLQIGAGATSDIRIDNCLSIGYAGTAEAIYLGGGTGRVRNCAIIRSGGAGITLENNSSNPDYDIQNNTIVGSATYGINRLSSAGARATNNYAGSNSTADYNGTFSAFTTNASSDLTGTLRSIAYSTSQFSNVTSGSENLHLVGGSALLNVGTDLSGSFTLDGDGDTRSAPWDIGFDEVISASAPAASRRRHQ